MWKEVKTEKLNGFKRTILKKHILKNAYKVFLNKRCIINTNSLKYAILVFNDTCLK